MRKHFEDEVATGLMVSAVRSAREVAGLTQHELAARLGVAQSMVARWETAVVPTLSVISRIEEVLGLSHGELLRRAGAVTEVVSVMRAIEEDPLLDPRDRKVLLATYRALSRSRRSANGVAH